ncbi:hypothetical protein LY90DRAFT_162452 [Neocallimastix californiae]|uniref:Uncharacterized protein n=1 Tax=Neocallimastix californiae TaxID=1754190 RepID=A0A1Y2ABT3_9FUNG|nr:hypothetical protein LY90DRAFT_162452 [Neocallimastix californiae]|eukprot:ORY19966.1 hypothetical protein LY90DRAFT_162452 [Neocallimastix californiae]
MRKSNTLIILIMILLCIGNVYSIDHSLGGDLEIKQSVIDKMKKEKFTYSFKELKSKKSSLDQQCSTLRGNVIYGLNYFARKVENFKSATEKAIDNCNMKKVGIYLLVGAFLVWYIKRVLKNGFLNKERVNVYFNESKKFSKNSYQDLSYPYYDNNTYLSNNNSYQYLRSYSSEMGCESSYHSREAPAVVKPNSSRFFSQRKRKNSNDENSNLFSYSFV